VRDLRKRGIYNIFGKSQRAVFLSGVIAVLASGEIKHGFWELCHKAATGGRDDIFPGWNEEEIKAETRAIWLFCKNRGDIPDFREAPGLIRVPGILSI
jgi:hypothetical protein